MAILTPNMIQQIRRSCIRQSHQARIEMLLARYGFQYLRAEACWVLPSASIKFYVEGGNWVGYHKETEPTYSGSGLADLTPVLEAICG